MLKFGIITEVLADKGMARVKFTDDDIVSAPLHCSVPISLNDQVQFPFRINQHVWCQMDELCERGVIGGAIYDEGNAPADGDKDIVRMKFDSGLELKYDRSSKKLFVTGASDVELDTTGKVEITAAVEVKITAPLTEVSGILKCASIVTTSAPGVPGLHIDDSGNLKTSGNMESSGEVKGATVVEGLIQLGTHKHTGVTTGGGISGTPTP
jgi:phage baseplate assembly protein gpV